MRWKIGFAVLALMLGISVGCQRQCFMTTDDLEHYKSIGEASLEFKASDSVTPAVSHVPAPATVFNSERKIRYITLAEVIATVLEQGTTGVQSPFFPGAINDLLVTFSGTGITGADNIRVLALQPAIIGSNIESALSKFDTRFIGNVTWSSVDNPVANALQTIQGNVSGTPVIAQENATASGTLLKPLPTGGVAGITFNTTYTLTNLRQAVNPNYNPNLVFTFEQPLLQGYGVEINQIRAAHPGSILNPFPNTARTEGILITRIRFDESRAEFERNLNFMLVNVEIAYWNLYGTYWTLYSNEAALRQAYEAWKINKARFEAGRIPIQDLAQSRQQYELFRGQRLAALGDCLEKERQLRGFMAFPVEDGNRLVPADQPILAPYNPDWQTAINEALAKRPELILARNEVKFRQLDLINQKNLLMPDLRFVSQYGYQGIGSRLDGPYSTTTVGQAGNAFRSLASGDFPNWTIGLQTTIPLGFRDANAAVRAARLNLAQSHQVLLDQERKAMQYLTFQYRQLFQAYEQIKIQRAQREAAAIQLEARFKLYIAGSKESTLDILLEAQRVWSSALQAEYANIVTYNNALASFEFAKGTIMEHNNVVISEGPLPVCAQVRAVEHERQRAKALMLRQRPTENVSPPGSIEAGNWKIAGVPYNNDSAALANIEGLDKILQVPPPVPEMSPKPRVLPTNTPAVPPGQSNAAPATGPILATPGATSPQTLPTTIPTTSQP